MKKLIEDTTENRTNADLGERIFKVLKGNGYQIKAYDETGNEVLSPSEAVQFFVMHPNIMISYSEGEIKLNKNTSVDIHDISKLTKSLRLIADENRMNYTIREFGKQLTPKQFSFRAKEKVKQMSERKINENMAATKVGILDANGDAVPTTLFQLSQWIAAIKLEMKGMKNSRGSVRAEVKRRLKAKVSDEDLLDHLIASREDIMSQLKNMSNTTNESSQNVAESKLSKLHGFKKTSYQTLGEVRLTFRHSKAVNEEVPQTRVRNIRSIALEHAGESYQFPCNYVLGARAMARHLSEGGTWDDTVGKYIQEMSSRYVKMMEFARYANRNKNLIEGNAEVIRLVAENTSQIRYDLKKFVSPATFAEYKEKFENSIIAEDEDNASVIKDQFTKKEFNNRLESVLPYISNLLKEKEEFESKLMSVIESGVYLTKTPVYTQVIEFDSPISQFAYKLKETANLLENEDLSVFLGRVSEKLSAQQKLDEFEIKVVRDVLSRASVRDFEKSQSHDLTESYVSKLDKKFSKMIDLKNIFNESKSNINESFTVFSRTAIDDYKLTYEDSPIKAIQAWISMQNESPMNVSLDTTDETDVNSVRRFYNWILNNKSVLLKMMQADTRHGYNVSVFVQSAVNKARWVASASDEELIEKYEWDDLYPFTVG